MDFLAGLHDAAIDLPRRCSTCTAVPCDGKANDKAEMGFDEQYQDLLPLQKIDTAWTMNGSSR
jgi:hypothetical protein